MVRIIRKFTQTPKLLLDGHIVSFSSKYTGETERFAGRYFIVDNPQQVAYTRYYTLPDADYKDIDLSNASTGKENLYPDSVDEIYEILLSFRQGDYLVYPIMPSPDRYFYKLGYAGMIPDRTNATKMYLGAWKYEDSPFYDPMIRLTFVKDLTPMILRTYIDSTDDYEKVTMRFLINRCTIRELKDPTPEERSIARHVYYYTELKKEST